MDAAFGEALIALLPNLRRFALSLSRKPDLAEAAEKRLKVPLRVLEQHLQRQAECGQGHLAAERFTVADLCVASVMGWVKPARALLEAHPATHAWLARCLDRPAQQAMRALARQQH